MGIPFIVGSWGGGGSCCRGTGNRRLFFVAASCVLASLLEINLEKIMGLTQRVRERGWSAVWERRGKKKSSPGGVVKAGDGVLVLLPLRIIT